MTVVKSDPFSLCSLLEQTALNETLEGTEDNCVLLIERSYQCDFCTKKRLKSKQNEIVRCSTCLVAEKDDVVSLDQGVEFPAAHQVGKEVEIFLSSRSSCVRVNVT